MADQNSQNIFQQKLSPGVGFIVVILVLALIALAERILYDIARIFVSEGASYFDNLQVIMLHAAFIIPLLALSIFFNVMVGEKKEKYAVVLIPYFVLSIVMALQLVFQISIYFYYHHKYKIDF